MHENVLELCVSLCYDTWRLFTINRYTKSRLLVSTIVGGSTSVQKDKTFGTSGHVQTYNRVVVDVFDNFAHSSQRSVAVECRVRRLGYSTIKPYRSRGGTSLRVRIRSSIGPKLAPSRQSI